jgi:hypothetical protein
MINFRFHIVSIIAVFLALGIGILMGATVIDQGRVRAQEQVLARLERQNDAASKRADALDKELDDWKRFADGSQEQLLVGRLTDVPVLVLAVEGADRDVVDTTRAWLRSAGAVDQGAVWLTARLALRSDDDVARLGTVLQSRGSSAPVLRGELIRQMSALFVAAAGAAGPPEPSTTVDPAATTTTTAAPAPTPPPGALLAALRDNELITYDASEGGGDLLAVPAPATRIVVISRAGSGRLQPATFVLPLARALATAGGSRVLAAEPSAAADAAAGVVAAIRADPATRAVISTIDDLDSFFGQVGVVLALDELGEGRSGHYGRGEGAQALVPAAGPPG